MKNKKTCEFGHTFYKSSDCPVCPTCEKNRTPANSFLTQFAAPARRALEQRGIIELEQLTTFSENEVQNFHGMGKSTLLKLQKMLENSNLTFKK